MQILKAIQMLTRVALAALTLKQLLFMSAVSAKQSRLLVIINLDQQHALNSFMSDVISAHLAFKLSAYRTNNYRKPYCEY